MWSAWIEHSSYRCKWCWPESLRNGSLSSASFSLQVFCVIYFSVAVRKYPSPPTYTQIRGDRDYSGLQSILSGKARQQVRDAALVITFPLYTGRRERNRKWGQMERQEVVKEWLTPERTLAWAVSTITACDFFSSCCFYHLLTNNALKIKTWIQPLQIVCLKLFGLSNEWWEITRSSEWKLYNSFTQTWRFKLANISSRLF